MTVLVVAEIFIANGARRYEAVGAGLAQLHEQAGAGDAGDAAIEGRADAVGEEMRDQAVGGLALGQHGAALGGRDLRTDLREGLLICAPGRPSGPSLSARINPRCTIRSA